MLAFTDYGKPFLLETDASRMGLRAVLSQKQEDGRYHPVAYGSRTLTSSERNYHSTKLEFLALKWAITKHFKEYLQYGPFQVRTDNNPLTYINTTAILDAAGHHWVGALTQYNFELHYQKGSNNLVADSLSRILKEGRLSSSEVQKVLDRIDAPVQEATIGLDRNCRLPENHLLDAKMVGRLLDGAALGVS